MPTGYTAALDDKDLSTAQWFTEHLARAFGILFMLRDSPDMTQEEITTKLREDVSKEGYHVPKLAEAKAEVIRLEELSIDALKIIIEEKNDEIRAYNQDQIEKAAVVKARHDRVRNELARVIADPNAHEVTKKIAEFGIDQLHVARRDAEPYKQDYVGGGPEAYRHKQVTAAQRMVDYHTENLEKDLKNNRERLEIYLAVIADVGRLYEED